ncbi:MAG: hypothetical protein MK042_11425 [Cognatishimia sp.]|nr:hypothetical protein [Cognatishimia sp.]
MDPRLELLLSSGGELVVKRRDAEAERVSLVGFAAVAGYLRWISARQDYVVLPRGWPVPNSDNAVESIGLTQAASWQSPMPQPLIPQAVQSVVDQGNQAQISEIAETSKEAFALLKEIADPSPVRIASTSASPSSETHVMFLELQRSIEALMVQLQSHQNCKPTDESYAIASTPPREPQQVATDEIGTETMELAPKEDTSLASRLEFLIEEIGLPADLALIVAQQGEGAEMAQADQSDVVRDILSELRFQLKSENAQEVPKEATD